MSGSGGVSSEVALDDAVGSGWWLVTDDAAGNGVQVLAGPYPDQVQAAWDATAQGAGGSGGVRAVYGTRRADGPLLRRPSPQDWAWLTHLGEQLERLPEDWDAALSDSDPLGTLVVEVLAVLLDAGFFVHDSAAGSGTGGVCLTPDAGQGGVIVAWRASDRLSIELVRGPEAMYAVAQAMTGALAQVLDGFGFAVEAFGSAALLVRSRVGGPRP